jgi:hypothetical protein
MCSWGDKGGKKEEFSNKKIEKGKGNMWKKTLKILIKNKILMKNMLKFKY